MFLLKAVGRGSYLEPAIEAISLGDVYQKYEFNNLMDQNPAQMHVQEGRPLPFHSVNAHSTRILDHRYRCTP